MKYNNDAYPMSNTSTTDVFSFTVANNFATPTFDTEGDSPSWFTSSALYKACLQKWYEPAAKVRLEPPNWLTQMLY